MQQSLYTASTGLRTSQQMLDVIAHNMANINTVGYRSSRLEFKEAMYQAMVSPMGQGNNLQYGSGSIPSHISRSFDQGTQISTVSNYDLSILGDGFFAVVNPQGETFYTRAGNFVSYPGADGVYLQNSSGNVLLGSDGQPLRIPAMESDFQIRPDGTYEYTDPNTGEYIAGQVGIYTFTNNGGLLPVGTLEYLETADSGAAAVTFGSSIKQRSLEGSNVDMTAEMTRMIRAQRAMQFAQKVVTTADDMESLANNLRT